MSDINHHEKQAPDAQLSARDTFDGIICFGGVDWWYHNRGHYDIQMMRELSNRVPVLYVNSIGMRPPKVSEGAMFFTRVKRKLKSLRRGLVRVRNNFSVFSPVTLPGGGSGPVSQFIARHALTVQVKIAARRCGIKRPLIWVACPPAATAIHAFKAAPVVYQRTDRFEDFEGVDRERIIAFDVLLKARAALVLFCSRELYNAERDACSAALFADHGVDFDRFVSAGIHADGTAPPPIDVEMIARPRAGFIGGIDSHTFDPELFCNVATALNDVEFVMVGGCSLPQGWCTLPNVHFLGQKPYDQVADYMAACDVLLMPWNQSDWIQACNPVKMKEYLAVGRPVVSTYFRETEFYADHIAVAKDAAQFVDLIRAALDDPGDSEPRRNRVTNHTWAAKAEDVWQALESH